MVLASKIRDTIIALTHSAGGRRMTFHFSRLFAASFASHQSIADGQLIMNHWRDVQKGGCAGWPRPGLPESSKYLIFTILCQLTYANFSLSPLGDRSDGNFLLPASFCREFCSFFCFSREIIKIFARLKQSGESKSLLNSPRISD